MKTFGEILKTLRVEKRLSQEDLSDELNKTYNLKINKGMISKWESNKSEARLESVRALSKFFDVSIDYFLGEKTDEDTNLTLNKKRLLNNFDKLNLVGQKEALKRVDELTFINKYTQIDPLPKIKKHIWEEPGNEYLTPIAAHDDNLSDKEKATMNDIALKIYKNRKK